MKGDFIGFVFNGVRKGCYQKNSEWENRFSRNETDNRFSDLGTAIGNFILKHTYEEFVEMNHKVGQVSPSILTTTHGRY
jgi:hypothetical protein